MENEMVNAEDMTEPIVVFLSFVHGMSGASKSK